MGTIEDAEGRQIVKDRLSGTNYKIAKSSSTSSETNIYAGAGVMTRDRVGIADAKN